MIFIIDDDENVLRGYQILLKSAALDCRVYGGVDEFLESWVHEMNDTLILDIHMPGMNGYDLLKYLKGKKLHLPVIVITAFDEDESRERAHHFGVLAYLTKPVDGEVLIDLLKNINTQQILQNT
jgi:FixJ family two-component response regulator